MSLPDPVAAAQLDQAVVKPVYFAFLDFVGTPVRANSSGTDISIAGSGQANLDGDYIGTDPRFVSVSSIKIGANGSDTVTARIAGIRGLDDADRALLADPANWQGRLASFWRLIRNADDVQQGGVQHYHTGYMMGLTHVGNAQGLALELSIESNPFAAPSGRTYLDQESFDEEDLSGRAALAIANGNMSTVLTSGAGGAGVSNGLVPNPNYRMLYGMPYL